MAGVLYEGDINLIDLTGDRRPKPLIQTRFTEGNGIAFSGDGRWLAYESNESGREEIYVRPFPDVDSGRWLILPSGGTRPVRSQDGRELFYLEGESRLMAVSIQSGTTFSAGRPRLLFDKAYAVATGGWTYDVAPDGRRFLMMKSSGEIKSAPAPTSLVVVQDFGEELKRLVPTK
jgi:serine/threonine-protein kinase